jgi:tetratricopeptide (TPR) repeat protein
VDALGRDDGALAARHLDALLKLAPDNPDVRAMRGIAANRVGDFARAARDLGVAVRAYGVPRPDTRDAFNEYALALRGVDDNDAAEQVLRDLVACESDFGAAWHNLAMVLHARGALDEAVAAARRSVAVRSDNPGALMLLGKLLREQGRLLASRAALLRARTLAPDDVSIETTLGNTLFYLGEIDPALGCFRRAAELFPDEAILHSNYATMLTHCRRYDEAIAEHEQAFALDPTNPDVVVRRAALLLNVGRLADGWRAYDARLDVEPTSRRWRGTPEWQGESLSGHTLCVYREQGIGDELMFASMYDELAAGAARTIVECDPRVHTLFARSFPGIEMREQTEAGNEPSAQHGEADVVVAAGSATQHLRTDLRAFTGTPWLYADAHAVARWEGRLAHDVGAAPYVGISWRSMIRTSERRLEYTRLDEWAPIMRHARDGAIRLVLLQYDECEREVVEAEARFGVRIHRWPDLDLKDDFDGVAALLRALDLVIAPRNAVTMLSGALGVPTLAIGNVGDWAECGTGQLPWFASVECINRRVDSSWEPVLAEVGERVTRMISGASPLDEQD